MMRFVNRESSGTIANDRLNKNRLGPEGIRLMNRAITNNHLSGDAQNYFTNRAQAYSVFAVAYGVLGAISVVGIAYDFIKHIQTQSNFSGFLTAGVFAGVYFLGGALDRIKACEEMQDQLLDINPPAGTSNMNVSIQEIVTRD